MLFTGDADMLVRHVMVVGPHDVGTPIGVIKLGHQGIHPSVPANRPGLCVTCFVLGSVRPRRPWPSGESHDGNIATAHQVTYVHLFLIKTMDSLYLCL